MKELQFLSGVIIEILKEFSAEKRPLNVDSLCNALCVKEQVTNLLDSSNGSGLQELCEFEGPDPIVQKRLARVALKNDNPAQSPNNPLFRIVRDTFSKILAELDPIAREAAALKAADLQKHISKSTTLDSLARKGEDLVHTVRLSVSRAMEQINLANEFLSELRDNLVGMEKELFCYQTHNRETFALHGQFCDNLLNHTAELGQAVSSSRNLEDTRSFIASRLSIIGKAIEITRREDEMRLQEADSRIAELQSSVRSYNQEILQMTERTNALEKEVLLDVLMEIHNRRAYDMQIWESLRNFHRTGQEFSLILIDVDRFKQINDKYGHRAGDKCLQEIARIVGGALRKADFLARYGGEELVVILPGSNKEDAAGVAEKIRVRIDKTRFYYQDEEIPLTISLGVTEVLPTDTDPEMPFVRVDAAMYQAKKEGRNRVCSK